ncbi:hypothetical protein, partial [Nodularia sphaerocarpa]|nr:hypothetical protein [Nodularia sphaerocarpa CS-585A2]
SCSEDLVQDLELKLDMGSKVRGIAIKQGKKIIFRSRLSFKLSSSKVFEVDHKIFGGDLIYTFKSV